MADCFGNMPHFLAHVTFFGKWHIYWQIVLAHGTFLAHFFGIWHIFFGTWHIFGTFFWHIFLSQITFLAHFFGTWHIFFGHMAHLLWHMAHFVWHKMSQKKLRARPILG
jgi:hypothetical protein